MEDTAESDDDKFDGDIEGQDDFADETAQFPKMASAHGIISGGMVPARDIFEDEKAGSLDDGADNIVIHGTGQRVQTAQRDIKMSDAEYVWEPVDPKACTGFDVRTFFGFCTLFMGRYDVRLPINMPEMVLMSEGILAFWFFTAKSGPDGGKVLRKGGAQLEPAKVKSSWMTRAMRDHRNCERQVAVLCDVQGAPTILGPRAFSNLISAMEAERNLGNRVLQMLQAAYTRSLRPHTLVAQGRIHQQLKASYRDRCKRFLNVLPLNNALYRATLSKKGSAIVQDAVLIRHSHIYRPLSATANVIYPTRHMRAVGERNQEPEEIMPPAPEAIKNECLRCLQILTRFMAKAWQLDLDEIVCDFVQDHDHKLSVPVPTF